MKRLLFCICLSVSGACCFADTASVAAYQPISTSSALAQSSPDEPAPTQVPSQATAGFDEALYLFANRDVAKLIQQGKYKSGLDHYTQVGQTAKRPDGEKYASFFTGTNGNDVVRGFGKGEHAHLAGVGYELVDKKDDPIPLRPTSLGRGEMDVLIGTQEGANEFLLGSFKTSVSPKAEVFYVGNGDADYARIQNFKKSKDIILLAGEPKQYRFESSGGNLRISTASGDLVAIVEGVDKLTAGKVSQEAGVFSLK